MPALMAFGVISVAVTGYFIGIQSPMNPGMTGSENGVRMIVDDSDSERGSRSEPAVINATSYENIRQAILARRSNSAANVSSMIKPAIIGPDSQTTIQITETQKQNALAMRDKNRAFNGAPPTVPHPVDQFSSESCMTCHGTGFKSESLRIPQMSHQFLANCSQCHVESQQRILPLHELSGTTFVGLPAPTGGPRAFSLAPPQIPHSTWMRSNCLSCHGSAGHYGIRTTHPWRQNCQQCHAPSSALDQNQLPAEPRFLPPPKIRREESKEK